MLQRFETEKRLNIMDCKNVIQNLMTKEITNDESKAHAI